MSDDNSEVSKAVENARRFRGQFMDMVHPSSDVKVVDKANYASQRQVKSHDESEENSNAKPRDFADEVSTSFEPTAVKSEEKTTDNDTDKQDIDDSQDESFQSPFLPNVKVEKRPLGSSDPEIPQWLRDELDSLSVPALPADDSGAGEPEPELPSSDDDFMEEPDDVDAAPEPKADHLKPRDTHATESKPFDMRAALENTMIQPQYKSSETAQMIKPQSPYVGSADELQHSRKRKHSVWKWILLYFLLAVAGAAGGVLLYMSGWLA